MIGNDNFQCVNYKSSCKTMGYIIDNACVSHVHLAIEIELKDNFTFKEPCCQNVRNGSYDCFVTVYGAQNSTKTQIEFAAFNQSLHWTQECNIFQKFFSLYTKNKTIDSCVCDTDSLKTDQQQSKLTFSNLVIKGLVLSLDGQPNLSAENVDFIDLQFSANASSKLPCFFHCDSCSFTSSGTQAVTYIELLNCLCLSLILQHSSFSQMEGFSSVKVQQSKFKTVQ